MPFSGVIMVALIMESIVISGGIVLFAVLASHKIAGSGLQSPEGSAWAPVNTRRGLSQIQAHILQKLRTSFRILPAVLIHDDKQAERTFSRHQRCL